MPLHRNSRVNKPRSSQRRKSLTRSVFSLRRKADCFCLVCDQVPAASFAWSDTPAQTLVALRLREEECAESAALLSEEEALCRQEKLRVQEDFERQQEEFQKQRQ